MAYKKVGNAQKAQGDLPAALTSYQESLATRDRLAKSDPGNAEWRRRLAYSYTDVGDVQMAQGDLSAAQTSYQANLAIIDHWPKPIPSTSACSKISRCPTRGSATCK